MNFFRPSLLLVALASTLFLAAQAGPSSTTPYQSPGTKKMAALLEQIFHEQDWKTDPNKSDVRAARLREDLAHNPDLRDELKMREVLAENLLKAGDSAGAVDELEKIRSLCAQRSLVLTPSFDRLVRDNLAIAYLRMGEQENCLHYHGQDSCLYPIKGGGVHVAKKGAEGAFRELTAALEKDPNDLKSRWLLNIAAMTLGKYPDDVPEKWRVPADTFKSEYDIGRFYDVATDVGLIINNHSGGAIMEDFDGDGLLDLMVSGSNPHDQLRFFHNNGDGSFSDRTREAGLIGETGGLNIVETDYNNDGHPDVLVLRGGWWGQNGKYPMSLLRNNGNGTFDDVTEAAGLMSLHPSQTAAWADYDNDGWLDLYVGHEANTTENHLSQLFHNNHDGTFTEVAAPNGLADMGFVKGVAWGDFNNDGRPDLYVSVKGAGNRLFRNDGPADPKNPQPDNWKFTDVTAQAGVADPIHSFATWFFDYDNDGWPDIYVSGFYVESPSDMAAFQLGLPSKAETPRLYRNNHDGTFTDVAKQMKLDRAILVMGSNFGDLDNDGWLDVYLGTGDVPYESLLPNRMFRNREGKVFQDVTTSGDFGHLQKGHAVAFGDVDNDGDEDVFEEMGGAAPGDNYPSVLYENPGHGNHWITLELEGARTNRAAFGARINVAVKSASGLRHIYRTVGYGSSFGGNPLRQHIGVGKAQRIAEIEVTWPTSKLVQKFRDMPVDHAFHLREGASALAPVEYKKFQLRHLPAGTHQH
ncbi:MAG TPA: FG-GAP-like repeat-containing protein [Candidatus Solibacter sp.]|nr:FG-GAP-like repeat-containing protein [Candidatus Solibacter sp.]